ncbi:hypothetical protein CPT_Margaery20 [Citrobacter phage Margaery]|uniref:Uncharacterized protein n=1 Tax=Citrobacter phage Margaery TaxID=1701810 RepID=A0A0M3UKZ7_9CAUD|nr:hypothetical protein CPT_Margaery20 [Citrobacter phage Margaery]ALF01709.1 hypothetical protein CPT_Margaery20 [Citrobacter phage Margaery]
MQEFMIVAAVLIVFLFSMIIVRLYQHGEAFEWFLDHDKEFQKHFAGEFIFTHVSVASGIVTFDFDGKGDSYHVELSLIEAKRVYHATQNGGMRKTLIPLAK